MTDVVVLRFALWSEAYCRRHSDSDRVNILQKQTTSQLHTTLPPGVASSDHWQPRLALTYVGRQAGLPSGQAHIAVEGADRRIWIAGPCGLCAYDGAHVISLNARHGLTSHGLRTLHVDAKSRIWIGSDVGVDYLDTDGIVKRVAGRRKWSSGPANHIVVTDDERIFVGTATGLVVAQGGSEFAPPAVAALSELAIVGLAQLPGGAVLAANSAGEVWRHDDDKWTMLPRSLFTQIGVIGGIAGTDDDRFIVFGTGGVTMVSRIACVTAVAEPLAARTPCQAATWIDGVLWTAHAKHIEARRDTSDGWDLIARADVRSSINRITGDRAGNIWCATDTLGCSKISALWSTVVQPEMPDAGQVYSLRRARAGTMLIGTENAVYKMSSQNRRPQRVAQLPNRRVWDVLDNGDGRLWAATHFDGLLRIHDNGFLERAPAHPVLSAPCRTLARFDDALFVGTLGGLATIRDGIVTEMTAEGGASLGYVYTLVVDRDWLWIGTLGNGLWKYSANAGLQQVRGPGLSVSGNTYTIAFREDFTRLVIQDNRFILLDRNHRATRLHETDTAVAGWTAVFRNATTLAVGDSEGLAEYEFPSMELKRRIRCGGIGLDGWEFISSRALAIDSAGRYWCGLNSGLTIVDHQRLANFCEPPVTKLLDVEWTNATAVQDVNRFRVPVGKWLVRFRYFTAWLIDETDIAYRHRLIGFENDWSPLSTSTQITYSSLPPGSYLLEVQAHSPLCGFGQVCLIAQIDVDAGGWTQRGFGGLARWIGGAVQPFSSRVRNTQLLRMNKELADKVDERTADLARTNRALRDTNEQLESLLRIDPLTGIANRRGLQEAIEREWKRAQRDRAALAVVMVDIDHFKRLNDHHGHAHGDTCLRLVAQCLAATIRNDIDVAARFGGEEFAILAPGSTGEEAMTLANRLCAAVRELQIAHERSDVSPWLTVSAGVAALSPSADNTPEQLFKQGDSALYIAKRRGRNQAWMHSDDPSLDEGA
jgi:diguanylate cyclase (GGDEF)-like protein